jgi:glutamate racemase
MRLGLYDSGLGGLTVLAALRNAGIDTDIVYFADQAHVPYGDRSDADVYALLAENFALLEAQGAGAIVMACNTSCAVAARRGGFPPTALPVLDLITNAAAALRATRLRRIAVVATAATVRSGAYGRAIAAAAPGVSTFEIAAPALVPLVERGLAASPQARAAVAAVCAQFPPDLDAIVYGCTHYPLLDPQFAALLDRRIARIDPALAQADAAVRLVAGLRLPAGSGRTRYLTNGDAATFERNVREWTGDRTGVVVAAAVGAR